MSGGLGSSGGYMILRFLKKAAAGEKGQALPLTLILLVACGLLIVPSIDFVSTSLNSVRTVEKGTEGLYAAEAGIEYTIWCLKNYVPPPAQLGENINQLSVDIQVESSGSYTLYLGELVQTKEHFDYLDVSGNIVWDEEAEAYRFTITVTWQPYSGTPTIHLEQVGARLPPGYSYQLGSSDNFTDNLSRIDPEDILDVYGAHMVNWTFHPPYPSVTESDPVKTQTFYFNGEGSLDGYYCWVATRAQDIGAVGEVTGGLYHITATATEPTSGEVVTRILADMMIGETAEIISWQISK